MPKLNQLIAVEKGRKADETRVVTAAYHQMQKPALWSGITKTYQPKAEDGDSLPGEKTRVQVTGPTVLDSVQQAWTVLLDTVATKDFTNQHARASIVIGDTVINDVPVSTLLYIEKRIVDMVTLVKAIPVLDPAETWTPSDEDGVWVAEPRVTNRTQKAYRNHVKSPATDKHPAQVEVFSEDVVVGTWTTKVFSGAIPIRAQQEMLRRLGLLAEAVKTAREAANMTEVQNLKVGAALLGYVFG